MESVVVERERDPDRFARASGVAGRFLDNIEQVVYGKRDEIKLVLTALACGGHVLLEDVPGTAKTMLARAIAGTIAGATPARIQCTPDLQPTDVTGLSVFDQKTRDLPSPFLLLATENPIEYEGTFPLPEAQLDRFFLRTALGYPGLEDELRILEQQRFSHPLAELEPAVSLEEVFDLRSSAQHVYVDEVLHRWLVELVRSTREHDSVVIGSSVRGSLALERAARAWALLDGRSYVVPEDVERLFVPVLVHRVVFTPGFVARARATGWTEAIEEFRASCLELAPRPGSEEDPFFGQPRP